MGDSQKNLSRHLFTSEAVTEGHPDKVCDQIVDAVLDACLEQDPNARVACEAVTKTGFVMLIGEITTRARVNYDAIARKVILDIGYDSSEKGFDGRTCAVQVAISEQSPDIARGVNGGSRLWGERTGEAEIEALGAGDQGIMFGYACRETPTYMPLSFVLANQLAKRLASVRKEGILPWLWPDGKTQVTVEYEDGHPVRVDTVLVSAQHSDRVSNEEIHKGIREQVIGPVLRAAGVNDDPVVLVNPTGRFVIGGPLGDSGLSGRKLIADTYGGVARHGGGSFSGKDPTKVDRSASYAARWVAKNLVAAGFAERCEVQVAYAIGIPDPLSVSVDTFGTGLFPDDQLSALVAGNFDLRPGAIIRDFDLRRPIYRPLAVYGHFGRDDLADLPWERLDRVEMLRSAAGLSREVDALPSSPACV